jgi:hypothetical protein
MKGSVFNRIIVLLYLVVTMSLEDVQDSLDILELMNSGLVLPFFAECHRTLNASTH